MSDPRTTLRLVDELLWSLRRDGFTISTAQAIDAVRAVQVVGFQEREDVRDAVAAVVLDRACDRPRFETSFAAFFDARRVTGGSLWQRLAAAGFGDSETNTLRALFRRLETAHPNGLAPLGLLLERGAAFDRLLGLRSSALGIDAHSGPQLGFVTHRLLTTVGAGEAGRALAALRTQLVEALGARGNALADALALELERSEDEIRQQVTRSYHARVDELEGQRTDGRAMAAPFAALSDTEIEEVRRAVRRFADRLRGGARVRARHARRGRIDPHRTLRLALRTAGVPFRPARKARRHDRPKLVLLCDVSDSVRAAAAFLLEFTYAVRELFDRARTFVFVSDLGETTQLFTREPVRVAIAHAWGGGVVRATDNSNYGRMLRTFESGLLRTLDRRTTVVILGDGRTNYHDASADVLDRIRERSRALLWLCPEPRGLWSHGDSAMPLYAPKCTSVYEVRSAADLERTARVLVGRG